MSIDFASEAQATATSAIQTQTAAELGPELTVVRQRTIGRLVRSFAPSRTRTAGCDTAYMVVSNKLPPCCIRIFAFTRGGATWMEDLGIWTPKSH